MAGGAEAGRRLEDLDIGIWAPMSVGPDRTLARDHARGRVASALRHPLPVPFSEEDRPVVERLRQGYDAFQHATAASRHRELVPDRLVDLMALAGTPDEVREQVRRVMTVPEIGRIIILPQVPDAGFIGARQHPPDTSTGRESWRMSARAPGGARGPSRGTRSRDREITTRSKRVASAIRRRYGPAEAPLAPPGAASP